MKNIGLQTAAEAYLEETSVVLEILIWGYHLL